MLLPRLFIVSSAESKLFAEALAAGLKDKGNVHAVSWARRDDPQNNKQLLQTLIKKSQTFDFAVVILTGDDIRTDLRNNEPVKVPRANCIFELGLFLGAFCKHTKAGVHAESERCFLLSSMEPSVLFEQLSDIAGQLYRRLEPLDFQDADECRRVADSHVPEILEVVESKRRFADRPRLPGLRIDDLLEREATLKSDDVVLVKENRPPELQLRYARTVMQNIRRPVRYLYLFGSKDRNLVKIVEVLRSLLATEVVQRRSYERYGAKDNEGKKAYFVGKQDKLSQSVTLLRKWLFIELIDDVEFDEFCIHRAGERDGQGYVKIDDVYVPVPSRASLLRFEHRAYKADKRWPTEVIFEPDALNHDQRQIITKHIKLKFPEELHEELISACFVRPEPTRSRSSPNV